MTQEEIRAIAELKQQVSTLTRENYELRTNAKAVFAREEQRHDEAVCKRIFGEQK